MSRDERGPWYLLTGVIIGIVLGLVYSWLIAPREYRDTSPASLRPDFKDQYRAMIALAYAANGDLVRAQGRLMQMGDQNVARALSEQAQRTLAQGTSPREAQALGLLAVALGQGTGLPVGSPLPLETQISTPTSRVSATVTNSTSPTPTNPGQLVPTHALTPTLLQTYLAPGITRTPFATGTPLPTRTPTSTPSAPFVLQEKTFLCDQKISGPALQILVETSSGKPLSGVEAVITWEGGEDHFFTGLKPELGLGYADFALTPGVTYTMRLAEGSDIVSDLSAAECETQTGTRYWGSWLLVFAQP